MIPGVGAFCRQCGRGRQIPAGRSPASYTCRCGGTFVGEVTMAVACGYSRHTRFQVNVIAAEERVRLLAEYEAKNAEKKGPVTRTEIRDGKEFKVTVLPDGKSKHHSLDSHFHHEDVGKPGDIRDRRKGTRRRRAR